MCVCVCRDLPRQPPESFRLANTRFVGEMTPSCILQDFLYLFESKEIFQKFHSSKTIGTLNDIEKHILFC